jgi:hypothetical protein
MAYFKQLEATRDDLEKTFGEPLDWVERPGKKLQFIRIRLDNADPRNRGDWKNQHGWIHEKLQKFYWTFSSAIKSLNAADYGAIDGAETE